ncbi:SSI family serine proteinase inhibitor [Aeromicrobium sp. P5_D10]
MARRLLAVATLAVLAACGGSSDSGSSQDDKLSIVVTLDKGADPTTYELSCDPVGGDHPQPEQACDVLDDAGVEVFEPVPADTMCTELYGGPQTAKVKGTYDGKKIDATFDRTNGCEIDRWEKLGTTFFNVPLL